jgi:L-fucose mutarotase
MLIGIPNVFSPDLLKVLMEMGHGDEIVLADGNFPAASTAHRLIRCDGNNIPDLLDPILQFFPIDSLVDRPVALMAIDSEEPSEPTIWEEYRQIIKGHVENFTEFELVERSAFYERVRQAYVVVATSEMSLYANVILRKGVVEE